MAPTHARCVRSPRRSHRAPHRPRAAGGSSGWPAPPHLCTGRRRCCRPCRVQGVRLGAYQQQGEGASGECCRIHGSTDARRVRCRPQPVADAVACCPLPRPRRPPKHALPPHWCRYARLCRRTKPNVLGSTTLDLCRLWRRVPLEPCPSVPLHRRRHWQGQGRGSRSRSPQHSAGRRIARHSSGRADAWSPRTPRV